MWEKIAVWVNLITVLLQFINEVTAALLQLIHWAATQGATMLNIFAPIQWIFGQGQ